MVKSIIFKILTLRFEIKLYQYFISIYNEIIENLLFTKKDKYFFE